MFLEQLMVISLMFAVCLIISFFINKYFESRLNSQKEQTKIYYITNMESKKKKNKNPKVAFKDITLKPQEFERYFIDDKNNKTKQ